MLLVTHNIILASPIAEYVVVLGSDGTVREHGQTSTITGLENLSQRLKVDKQEGEDENIDEPKANMDELAKTVSRKLIQAEEKAAGKVRWPAMKLYINSVGGPWVWIAYISLYGTYMLLSISQRWIFGYWTAQYNIYPPSEVPVIL